MHSISSVSIRYAYILYYYYVLLGMHDSYVVLSMTISFIIRIVLLGFTIISQ
jgi:hypothetical protein